MIGASKLTEENVAEIRSLFANTTMSDSQIARKFDVSRIHINQIRNGRRWNEETRSFLMKESIGAKGSDTREVVGEPAPYYPTKLLPKKKRGIFQLMFWHIGKFFISLSNN